MKTTKPRGRQAARRRPARRRPIDWRHLLSLLRHHQLAIGAGAAAVAVLALALKSMNASALPAPLLQYVSEGFGCIALVFLLSSGLTLVVQRYRARKANPYARLRWDREPRFDMPRMRPEPHVLVLEHPLDRPRATREPAPRDRWSAALLTELDSAQFAALGAAYYAMRRFRVERIMSAVDGDADARLYFRTLPNAVAIMRCISWSGAPVGVKAVREIQRVAAEQGVSKAILHVAGECTPEAQALARAQRIQLVSGADFVANILTLPEAGQRQLLALVAAPRAPITGP